MGQSPVEGEAGIPPPHDGRKGKVRVRCTWSRSEIWRKKDVNMQGVPNCFCFLSDVGGKIIRWEWAGAAAGRSWWRGSGHETVFSLVNTLSFSDLFTRLVRWCIWALHCPPCYWFCISLSFTALIKLRTLSILPSQSFFKPPFMKFKMMSHTVLLKWLNPNFV